MHCEQAGQMMSEWLDGRLDAAEFTVLEEHLATCSNCRMDREALQSLDRLFASAPLVAAPIDLRARTMTRLNRRYAVRRALTGGLALAFGTVMLALLFVAPLLPGLFSAHGLWPVLSRVGPETAERLLAVLWTIVRTAAALIGNLAVPAILVSLCSLLVALLLNCLWLRTLRRLRTTS